MHTAAAIVRTTEKIGNSRYSGQQLQEFGGSHQTIGSNEGDAKLADIQLFRHSTTLIIGLESRQHVLIASRKARRKLCAEVLAQKALDNNMRAGLVLAKRSRQLIDTYKKLRSQELQRGEERSGEQSRRSMDHQAHPISNSRMPNQNDSWGTVFAAKLCTQNAYIAELRCSSRSNSE